MLILGGVLLVIVCSFVDQGGLRRRVDHVRHVMPRSVVSRPYATTVERHPDGTYHYGLRFRTPWQGENSRIAWYSVWDTRLCDRGPITRWQCNPRTYDGTTLEVVVYLPRSWLVLHGYLPLTAALTPGKPQPLRDVPSLLATFWLEEYELSGADGVLPGWHGSPDGILPLRRRQAEYRLVLHCDPVGRT